MSPNKMLTMSPNQSEGVFEYVITSGSKYELQINKYTTKREAGKNCGTHKPFLLSCIV